MASSPISKIPNETLDRIVQYAGELTDISTLRLVSKGFYECSQPAFLDKLHYTVLRHNSDKDTLTKFLTYSLVRFPKLENVEYLGPSQYWDDSSRYQFLEEELGDHGPETDEEVEEAKLYYCVGMVIGFEVLFRALTKAKVSPKELAFPVTKLSVHGFSGLKDAPVFLPVAKKAEALHIHYSEIVETADYYFSDIVNHTELLLTAANFPSLRRLEVDITLENKQIERAMASTGDLPELDHITVRFTGEMHDLNNESRLVDLLQAALMDSFLNKIGAQLKTLSLINFCIGDFSRFLAKLGKLNLEKLEIKVEEHWHIWTPYRLMLPQDLLEQAANTVFVDHAVRLYHVKN